MSYELPQGLRQRVNAWLVGNSQGSQREAARALSVHYAAGQGSSKIGLAPYLTARMPATFATVANVLADVAKLRPNFAPKTVLDVGAGPGTASFAAQAQWPSLKQFTLIEADVRFAALAQTLVQDELPNFEILQQRLQQLERRAEVVMAAYVLVELPEAEIPAAAQKLWQACAETLVMVEPGTPQGFARLRTARTALIDQGANLIGPCTHQNACPMAVHDWCHFKTRLARSREHMHAKGASVPFEDEAYTWVAFSRSTGTWPAARVIAPVEKTKAGLTLPLCSQNGLTQTTIARREKPDYKAARHVKWGDAFTPFKED
jgi:ribosomal protein RSM22 (predicted rRNA methylase)